MVNDIVLLCVLCKLLSAWNWACVECIQNCVDFWIGFGIQLEHNLEVSNWQIAQEYDSTPVQDQSQCYAE